MAAGAERWPAIPVADWQDTRGDGGSAGDARRSGESGRVVEWLTRAGRDASRS
jgi:hypothetical protein